MNQGSLGILAVIGGLAAIFLVALAALATYNALADNDVMDDMGGMMDGMMGGGGPETTGSASGRGDVRIADFRFEPTVLTVTPGTVVKWTNEDSAPHTATARDGSFDTGRLNEGESSEITFDTAGTFEYICEFHPSMEGRITVQ
ncbi:MAG: cupredoxin family copper-binding protein [Dehalococcoidia bacterium]|nr:cupredoxin family copper-binding protein [Dehalococcoidia bacterium]